MEAADELLTISEPAIALAGMIFVYLVIHGTVNGADGERF